MPDTLLRRRLVGFDRSRRRQLRRQFLALAASDLRSSARRSSRAQRTNSASAVSDPDAAAILLVRESGDQIPLRQPVDPVRHRSGCRQRHAYQLTRGKLVGRAGPEEGRQDVELPVVEGVRGERLFTDEIQTPGKARHARKNGQRAHVEFGRLAAPSLDDAIYVVHIGTFLDVEILATEIDFTRP